MQTSYGTGEYRTGESAFICTTKALGPARTGVVMVAGGGRTAALDNTGSVSPVTLASLADCGYPVHAGDYCGHGTPYWLNGGWTWGNGEAISAIDAGVTYLTSNGYAKSGKVFLFAGSMGATDAMNYYKANPSKVAGIALTIPLLDLNDMISNDKGFAGAASGSFVAASMYGLTLPQATINLNKDISISGLSASGTPGAGGAANKVNVLTSNGWQVVTFTGIAGTSITGCTGGAGTMSATSVVSQGFGTSAMAAYSGTFPTLLTQNQLAANSPAVWAARSGGLTVPVRIWSSDNDFIASNTNACYAFGAACTAAAGGNVTPTVVPMGNIGHVSTVLDARQVAAWFDSIGGRS